MTALRTQLFTATAITALACAGFSSAASALPTCAAPNDSKYVLGTTNHDARMAALIKDVIAAFKAASVNDTPAMRANRLNSYINYYATVKLPAYPCIKGAVRWTKYRISERNFFISYWHNDSKDNNSVNLRDVANALSQRKNALLRNDSTPTPPKTPTPTAPTSTPAEVAVAVGKSIGSFAGIAHKTYEGCLVSRVKIVAQYSAMKPRKEALPRPHFEVDLGRVEFNPNNILNYATVDDFNASFYEKFIVPFEAKSEEVCKTFPKAKPVATAPTPAPNPAPNPTTQALCVAKATGTAKILSFNSSTASVNYLKSFEIVYSDGYIQTISLGNAGVSYPDSINQPASIQKIFLESALGRLLNYDFTYMNSQTKTSIIFYHPTKKQWVYTCSGYVYKNTFIWP